MEAIDHPSAQPVPPAAVSRILSRFSRTELEGFVAVAIDLMDVADDDPDLEDDDPAGGNVEDEGEREEGD
ncbi:hypothetical protein FHS51_000778 [Sphingobium wenxiniae]|uniref:Uncharacterized protein n=1 Tax=Sphingobium wenxiniae (strain DSM 21828 / CGMCC 1.7748 / JZ-1) TaxID=595605 RepID=A0A562KIN7_SPHWJ|nr:hypothetical protein [Sphingobium wenxiniae]MBB6190565.1 hypothetical protein [Sphingobium wenxiniae]TWH95279.1 hypothetical protein IQ35_01535 [Sphingobium wenxiniae]